tara:strand:- start:538 stop:1038 length:501 start_codon:yes stop_codon:yes gene_type:complete
MKSLSKEDFLNVKLISRVEPSILNINNHPKIPYVSSMKILTNNFTLERVEDIVNYWKRHDFNSKELNDLNWMYVYCMKYGFLKNLDVKNINIYGSWKWTTRKYNLTQKEANNYLSTLEPMSHEEIELFLKTPIEIKNNIIEDGTHRCCSMIGRLVRDEKYININYV